MKDIKKEPFQNDTICAISTPYGSGAISVIRLSGNDAIMICKKVFTPNQKKIDIAKVESHSLHLGKIFNETNTLLDEVIVGIFRDPHSYTGEDIVEISCHGSIYIQEQILQLLIRNGARAAKPGEFTLRAFLNGKMDLAQAEAVADLISSQSNISHKLAIQQMKGGFSEQIKHLRNELVEFSALLELELDFSEEDVEFANREKLTELLSRIKSEVLHLLESYSLGNVLKNGIPVTIIGKPNVGKSTLLNILLNEDRAIVSEIPGTTRDAIEDTMIMNGICFRFIDTAGLREAQDKIESIGVERTYEKIANASIILYMFDISESNIDEIKKGFESKFRYNIHIAEKKGVIVQQVSSLKGVEEFYQIYTETASRQTFIIHPLSYYKKIFDEIICKGMGSIFIAYHENKPVAGVFIFTLGGFPKFLILFLAILYPHFKAGK